MVAAGCDNLNYMTAITSARSASTLRTIWTSSGHTRHLCATGPFSFTCPGLKGWTGRICMPEGPMKWFDTEFRSYDLGLQMTRNY